MKKITFFFAMLSAVISLTARDFDYVTSSGHTIYCDIVPGGAMIVGWDCSSVGDALVSLTIPSTVNNGTAALRVVAIGDDAFKYDNHLLSVDIPSSVTSIGHDAFNRCFSLGSIAIPSGVATIGEEAFAFIPNVEYTGSAEGAPWGALNVNAYHEEQYYYSDSQKTNIVCCKRDAAVDLIPSTVTSIGPEAFAYCQNITSLTIDSNIVSIGYSAFANCPNLETVFFNPNISSSDATGAFFNCSNIRQFRFGNTVTCIPSRLCSGCSSIQCLVIPDNIIDWGSECFFNCSSLDTLLVGKGISSIGISMFEGCSSIRTVQLPDNVETIQMYAFDGCESLQSIVIGRNVDLIQFHAFTNCSSLTEIVLPSSVNYIDPYAFSGCTSVSKIVCMRSTPPRMGDNVFDDISTDIDVFVPCDKIYDYEHSDGWRNFDSIKGKAYYMVVTSNNPLWGRAVVTQQPTCDDNTAVLEAFPAEGYRFVKWSDFSTDNPHQINHDGRGYSYRQAIFEATMGLQNAGVQPDVSVYASRGNVVIEGAQGQRVWLFDIMGRQLGSYFVNSPTFQIPIHSSSSGIFVVKVGAFKTTKLLVRQ